MSTYYSFNEHAFRGNVKKALEKVETILKADRRPLLAEEIHHKYENKYDLANHMTNIAIVAQMNVLERLGLAPQIIQQLVENVKTNKKTVTLRFEANETCKFLKEQTVDVPDPRSVETVKEKTSTIGSTSFKSKSSTIHKVIRKVKEYHWAITSHRELTVFLGTDVEKKTMIQSRDSSTVVITQSQNAPMEKVVNHTPIDLNLTWLLEQIDTEQKATTFSIDTSKAKTPRRNAQVEASLSFFASRLNSWSGNVKSHFSQTLQRFIRIHNPAIPLPSHPQQLSKQCSADDLFLPILPVLEERHQSTRDDTNQNEVSAQPSLSTLVLSNSHEITSANQQKTESVLLTGKDTNLLLNAQAQSIEAKLKSLNEAYPPSHQAMSLFSIAEATMYLLLDHAQKLCSQYQNGIGYLEHMLEKQLVSAIGKRVTNKDLEEFVRFHNAKFLTIPPKPFCHAIGRPNRFPYGVLSIEKKTNGNDNTIPIETLTRPVIMSAPLEVPLNAATSLQLTGNTYLHGWLRHRSEQGEGIYDSYQLSARARQFSSFLLVIGTMASGNKMIPKDAIILQNKDEVLIPLLLDEIPSAKEFKNAIESLSPEQQQFAQSFRGMQLESSVFGVAVIQIKPQLETLLGLPEDSLSKEIKLTEDLMELFVEHQVPSDLLSFDDNGIGTQMSPAQKVDSVRQNVKAVMDVIEDTKVKQLEKALMEEEARKAAEEAKKAEEIRELAYVCSVAYEEVEEEEEEGCGGMDMFGDDDCDEEDGDWSEEADEAKVLDDDNTQASSDDGSSEDNNDEENEDIKSSDDRALPKQQAVDFTKIPKILDATIERFDKDSNLRSTKLKVSDTWSRKRQPDLLTKATTSTLYSSDVKSESNKAYDLLDAISRSGSLPIAYSDLHVVVCVTHCFEKDIMATVVEDNVNPIEKLEMSTLLLGSAIHGTKPLDLIAEQPARVRFVSSFPLMLEEEKNADC